MSVYRLIIAGGLLVASAWVALINGQPLFHPDTSAYVRGPDFAVVYFFGNGFATSWTQKRTLEGDQKPANSATSPEANQLPRFNSPFDKSVLSGRSIYYGALLYLGHLAGDLWLPVILQGAVFVYLTYTLVVTCLRFSLSTLLIVDLIILILTPISFFVSYLMPDIFASFLVLGIIILFAFWDVLKKRDRIIVSMVVLYSAVVHSSNLLLLLTLAVVTYGIKFLSKRWTSSPALSSLAPVALVLFGLCGILAELAFTYATQVVTGARVIRPPFIMARLIADGPGYEFLKNNCSIKPYAVCHFIDRLPTVAPAFLWSTDTAEGIFSVADPPTRLALSSEQIRFAFDVIRFDPLGVIVNTTKNTFREFLNIGIVVFFLTPNQLEWAKGSLPNSYFEKLLRTRIVLHNWSNSSLRWPVTTVYLTFYVLSLFALALSILMWPSICTQTKTSDSMDQRWFYTIIITTAAVILNAAICGGLSDPLSTRYQTRIAWIPVFILLLLLASLWRSYGLGQRDLNAPPAPPRKACAQ